MSNDTLRLVILETGSTRIVGKWVTRDRHGGWVFSGAAFERRSTDAMGTTRWESSGDMADYTVKRDDPLATCIWGTVMNLAETRLLAYRESLVVRPVQP